MSKSNRIYKIFMATMIVAIAAMLLAMGIIAAQRTMKVNVAFPANPYYKIEIWIQKSGGEEKLAFCNFEDKDLDKEIVMQNGISSLDGNTIQADNSFFTTYENEFSIIIKNYTTETGIEVSMSSTGQVDENTAGIPAQFDPIKTTASKFNTTTKIPDYIKFDVFANAVFPQTTTLKMTISELASYEVSFNVVNSASGNISETVDYGTNYSQTLTAKSGYVFNGIITVNGIQSGGYFWEPNGETATFSIIDWSKVTGPISIVVTAIQNTFTITFDANGGSFASGSTYAESVVVGANYSMPTPPTMENYVFLGWATTNDAVDTSWEIGTQTANSDKTWYAVWKYAIYSVSGEIVFEVFMDGVLNSSYSVPYNFTIDLREGDGISKEAYMGVRTYGDPRITLCTGINEDDVSVTIEEMCKIIINFLNLDSVSDNIVLNIAVVDIGGSQGGAD